MGIEDIPRKKLSAEELNDNFNLKKQEKHSRVEQVDSAALALDDQGKIEQIRREIAGQKNPDQGGAAKMESYQDLPNVKSCVGKLKALLDTKQQSGNLSDRAKGMIYEMLTRRSEFVRSTEGAGKDVVDLMKDLRPQMEWYRNTREALELSVSASGEFKWDSNPGWFGINTRPEVPRREGVNIKTYTTIPVADYAFIQHIPKLAKELRKLAIESDDIIQVKIPESLSGFLSHNDSVVVHFKKKENADKILETLDNWMQSNSINESEREMGRTRIAADSKDASFSELVAENIAKWLEMNAGKYDASLLASEAVKHAISQSQKSPL